jgi:pyruvate dehydrogenase E2 component (dihydrolipoamide acetyltransferase)
MAEAIRMPRMSDTMTEGVIVAWHKKVGDKVKPGDLLAEVETDKATMELESYNEGTLLYIGVDQGKAVQVDGVLAVVGKEGEDYKAVLEETKPATDNQQPAITNTVAPNYQSSVANDEASQLTNTDQRIKASPLAKKLAADKGINLTQVNGSGDNGRITKKDIDSYKEKTEDSGQSTEKQLSTINYQLSTNQENHTDIPLTQMRKVIARRLAESKFSAPHFYLTMEINMDNAMAARVAMNEVSPVKISFNDMLIKGCAMALRSHPDVNSSWMSDFIRQNHHIHIGSAVAMPEGLIVPVIKFADQKSLSQIAGEAKELYGKAKDKKLQPPEFSGNTFTISNLGMMDIEEFTAIINPPDSCILAVGKIKETVVKKGDGFAVTNIMKLTLSCDHRSVDGAVGASFLQTLKKFMENPVTMLV